MADETKYPQLPANVWWELRRRFVRSMPGTVTPAFLSTTLNVKEAAAASYLRELKKIGIVDEEGVPTDLAYDWRNDERYGDACKIILDSTYPDELLAIAPFGEANRDDVTRWFMNAARLGKGTAQNKSAFYDLVANPSLGDATQPRALRNMSDPQKTTSEMARTRKRASAVPKEATSVKPRASTVEHVDTRTDSAMQNQRTVDFPGLHLNIQIHIGADATSEQIDAIFSSMAKHLRK